MLLTSCSRLLRRHRGHLAWAWGWCRSSTTTLPPERPSGTAGSALFWREVRTQEMCGRARVEHCVTSRTPCMYVGYGGWPAVEPFVARHDGFVSRPDTWETYDGISWRELNWNNTFQGRAWMGMAVLHDADPRVHFPHLNHTEPPKMYPPENRTPFS